MTGPFYAHSKEHEPPDHWQPLDEHLKKVAELARSFADEFGAGDWGYLAGLWHDLGKYAPEFQEKLRASIDDTDAHNEHTGKVNHSTAGALHACERLAMAGRILAYQIVGHHAGLPDWHADKIGNAALSVRIMETALLDKLRNDRVPAEILDCEIPKDRPKKRADAALWIRMLFSCLVDADFLDTELFLEPEKFRKRGGYPDLEDLLDRFTAYMAEKQATASDTLVNRIRSTILARCIEKAGDQPGVYTLTVPTGGGKTLSSMAFALHHAAIHGKRRVIYVIPYTSIIEQTADQFRSIFGDSVIEHHSNFDGAEDTAQATRLRLACENWDVIYRDELGPPAQTCIKNMPIDAYLCQGV